mgnify:CR=1 FL=1
MGSRSHPRSIPSVPASYEVRLRRAREVVPPEVMAKAKGWREQAEAMNARYEAPTEADAEWADAIVFGTPTRFGSVSSELKAYIDGLGWADWDPEEFLEGFGRAAGQRRRAPLKARRRTAPGRARRRAPCSP